jgi:hypothetical protein
LNPKPKTEGIYEFRSSGVSTSASLSDQFTSLGGRQISVPCSLSPAKKSKISSLLPFASGY